MLVVHNMSAAPRTNARAEKRGIADRIVVFALAHALIARGVLEACDVPETLLKGKEFGDFPQDSSGDLRVTVRGAGHHLSTFSPESASLSLCR